MSTAASLLRARKARLARIAARAVPQAEDESAPPPPPPPPPRHVVDQAYERAWAAVMLGWSGDRRRTKRRIEDIQEATARYFGLARADLLANERAVAVARPRQVAMFLARELTTLSWAEIGTAFAGRDHSNVLHAVKRVRQLLTDDAGLRSSVDSIRATLIEF